MINETDGRDVVTSENTVSDEGGHHGALKKKIFRIDGDTIDRAKQNAGEFDDSDNSTFLLEETYNENEKIDNNPDHDPGAWNFDLTDAQRVVFHEIPFLVMV